MSGSPFNNEDMPFYLLAISLAPATIYFKNGNNWKDVHFWINFLLFFPVVFSVFGHIIAIGHAWWFIYHKSAITGNGGNSYMDHLQIPDDDDEADSFDRPVFHNSANENPFNQETGSSSLDGAAGNNNQVPSYSDAVGGGSNGKQNAGGDHKVQH